VLLRTVVAEIILPIRWPPFRETLAKVIRPADSELRLKGLRNGPWGRRS